MLGGHVNAASFRFLYPVQRGFNLAARTFQRHPFLVKTVTSGIGFAAGDALAQLAALRKPGARYDWRRTAKMAGAGWVAAGPLGYLFLAYLETVLPGSGRAALAAKFTLDQVLGCALWHGALLSIHEPYRKAALGAAERAQQALQARRLQLVQQQQQHLL